jgi:hypothetical protein
MPLTRISGPSSRASDFGQHHETGFGGAIHRMSLQRPERMNIDHIDDESAPCLEARGGRLREKQGRLHIAADEIVPLRPR